MTWDPARNADSAPGRTVELELKYRPSSVSAGDRYLSGGELAGFRPVTPARTTQVEDRYVDTAGGALAAAGYAARLRTSAGSTIVSLKSTAPANAESALHRRDEIEGPAARTTGPLEWPPSDARSLILELCGDRALVELVTIRQLRRGRRFEAGGTVLHVSLDEVEAIARSEVVDRFLELEVELVRGDEAALGRVGEMLDGDPTLTAAPFSKFEAGLNAIRGGRPRPSL